MTITQSERRGPGRPRNDAASYDLAPVKTEGGSYAPDPEDRAELHARRRTRRGGVNGFRMQVAMDRLDFNSFAYRWINDSPGGARIYDKTKNDDWDIVSQDGGTVKGDALDGAVSFVVGTSPDGSALRAYLCRKPKKYFEEDAAEKQADLDRQLAMMSVGRDAEGAMLADYVPKGGIRL